MSYSTRRKRPSNRYASTAFSEFQTNNSATKRGLLAIETFTRHFKHYLLGGKFKIDTNH